MRGPWRPRRSATTSSARIRPSTRSRSAVAALLGKEAALWLPTGTMANQVALQVLTRPGDDVVVAAQSHAVWHEAGASAANAGVQFTEIGAARRRSPPRNSSPRASRAGIRCSRRPRWSRSRTPTIAPAAWSSPQAEATALVRRGARPRGRDATSMASRLWNAAVATGLSVAELAAPFDVVVGGVLEGARRAGRCAAGRPARRHRAGRSRHRRMLGGAMRQVGFFAAAALYALDHHLDAAGRGPRATPA